MEINQKSVSKKSSKSGISIVLYIAASIIALAGATLLVNNIILYKSTVTQALAGGYDIATVRKALLTSQLLPGIVEPIGIYGGIAFILLGVAKVNKKVSNFLTVLTKVEVSNDIMEENIEQNVFEAKTVEEV